MTDRSSGAGFGDAAEEELLTRLRGPYLESAGAKSQELAVMLCRCAGASAASPGGVEGHGDEHPLALSHRLAHSMAGSGASYGFPDISDRARFIERELRALMERGGGEVDDLLEILGHALDLRREIHRARSGE